MAGNTLRKKQEIIKQQEKQIKQYEELLMAISKENKGKIFYFMTAQILLK